MNYVVSCGHKFYRHFFTKFRVKLAVPYVQEFLSIFIQQVDIQKWTRLLGHPVPGCDDLHEHGEIVENVSAEPPLLTVVVETGPAHTAGSRLFKATRTNRP